MGVNDLVGPLYGTEAMAQYELLHGSSVDVRYYKGLFAPLDRVKGASEWIMDAHGSGLLRAA